MDPRLNELNDNQRRQISFIDQELARPGIDLSATNLLKSHKDYLLQSWAGWSGPINVEMALERENQPWSWD